MKYKKILFHNFEILKTYSNLLFCSIHMNNILGLLNNNLNRLSLFFFLEKKNPQYFVPLSNIYAALWSISKLSEIIFNNSKNGNKKSKYKEITSRKKKYI